MASGNGLKILAWAAVAILVIIAAYISRSLIGTIMFSILLTFMLYPIYELAFIKTKSKKISSLIAISAIVAASALIILIFYWTVSMGLSGFSADISLPAKPANPTHPINITASNIWSELGVLPSFSNSPRIENIKTLLHGGIIPLIASYILPAIAQKTMDAWIYPLIESSIQSLTFAAPILLAQIIIAAFLAYYLLMNGKDAILRSPDLLPKQHRTVGRHFISELGGVFKTLLTTNFDIAAYNALAGIIIFSMIGVPFAAAWAIISAFLSLIRFLGPWLIFVPLSISLFLINDIPKGFLVLLLGAALLEYVPEYILRPRISEGSSPVNTAFAFLSYAAPIFVLGPAGIIIGPFVYGLLIAAYRTARYFREKETNSL